MSLQLILYILIAIGSVFTAFCCIMAEARGQWTKPVHLVTPHPSEGASWPLRDFRDSL